LLENAEVSEALEIVERAAFNDTEMRMYDKFWDSISSYRTLMYALKKEMQQKTMQAEKMVSQAEEKVSQAEKQVIQAEQKAEQAEQKAKQAEQKMKQEKINTAYRLKAKNVMTTAEIAEITGLTLEEINAL